MSGNKKFPRTHAGRLAADMVLRYYTHDLSLIHILWEDKA